MAYSEEQIKKAKEIIIEGLSIGKSLKSILDNDKKLPSRPIIYEWLNSENHKFDKDFLNNYTRARVDSGDIDAENVEAVAELVLKGKLDPASARVVIDAYKWTAGKKKPKRYGDKIQTEHSGEVKVETVTGFNITSN